jgi:hypothetical protein
MSAETGPRILAGDGERSAQAMEKPAVTLLVWPQHEYVTVLVPPVLDDCS